MAENSFRRFIIGGISDYGLHGFYYTYVSFDNMKIKSKKVSYRSPLFEMAKKASGSLRGPKKNYSLSVDKVVYGSDNRR